VTVYYLEGDLSNAVKITDPEEFGKFFSESVYVVDVEGEDHRYMICWTGPALSGEQIAKTSTAMDKLCNYELSSDMSRMRVN
jgi:hypothetical protein